MDLLPRVVLVAVGFPLFCVGIGWGLLAALPDLDREERFAAGGVVGAAFLVATAFVTFLTGLPALLIGGAALIVLLAIVFGTRRPVLVISPSPWPLVGLCALGYLHLLLIQALLPEYVGGLWMGDWQHHYLGARVFAGLEPVDTEWGGAGTYTVASRTPLFNLAAAFVLELGGPEFPIYQTASTFLNVCFLPVVFVLLRDLFGRQAAKLGLLLASLNLWLLHLAWFTWPKLLAVALVLLGLHFYLRSLQDRASDPARARRYLAYGWISLLLGYLTHQAAVVYLVVLMGHAAILAWRERGFRFRGSLLAFPVLSAAALLGPWYGWLLYHFGVKGTLSSTPTTQMDPAFTEAHGPAKVLYLLASVGYNLGAALVPFTLFTETGEEPWTWCEWYGRATDFYFNQLTGALTLSLSLYLLIRGGWALRGGLRTVAVTLTRPEWSAVWAFALLGGLGAALLHPLRSVNGIAHSAIFVTSVLLVVLAWGALSRAMRSVRMLVCAGMVAEFLAMFWTHIWLAHQEPLVLDPYGINTWVREDSHIVLLNHCLSSAGFYAVAVGTVCVQCALIVLLTQECRRDPAEVAGKTP